MHEEETTNGRTKQRLRTRKDLLQAAAKLVKEGRKPTLEEIAETAMISRATAYRYFSNVEAILAEAGLDMFIPSADELFAGDTSTDAFERIWKADQAINSVTFENHITARITLALLLQQSAEKAGKKNDTPVRQNRRSPMIAAALTPVRDQFKRGDFDTLSSALALFIGIEAMVVFKDVLRLDDETSEKIRRWAMHALIDAAKNPTKEVNV